MTDMDCSPLAPLAFLCEQLEASAHKLCKGLKFATNEVCMRVIMRRCFVMCTFQFGSYL